MGGRVLACLLLVAPAEVSLRWAAPPSCPETAFREAIARQLEGRRLPAQPRLLRASAQIDEDTGHWRLQLWLETTEGTAERVLEGESCAAVVDAGAFVVATAIDPTLEPVPKPVPVAVPEPADEPSALGDPTAAVRSIVVAPSSRPAPTRGESLRAGIRLDAGVDAFTLPAAHVIVLPALALVGRGYRVEATGGYRLATHKAAAADPSVGGRFSLWLVGARGCWVPRVRRLELPVCGGVEAGQVVGKGELREGRTTRLPWAAAELGAGLFWPLGRHVALHLAVQGVFPLVRSAFVIEGLPDGGHVHRVGPAGLRGRFGLELRLPALAPP